ncbi:STAS domain-containing protein [Pseudonocardia sp. H11422]|uniref:STAS domain-containing protein n=1 Tax=Pseudonocardia sp. H11422 TaxID=2835866 RepID=UPI001BDC2D8F|nr:STAS domain-containing protein [Pseudonocardia sp. H11422]
MQVRLVRQADGAMVVRVTGEIDQQTAPALQECVVEQLCLCYDPVVLDLTAVRFLDSAGITALIGAARDAHRAGATLCVVADHRAVLEPLRCFGGTSALNVCPTVPVALTTSGPSGGAEPPPGGPAAAASPMPAPSRITGDPAAVRHRHPRGAGSRSG